MYTRAKIVIALLLVLAMGLVVVRWTRSSRRAEQVRDTRDRLALLRAAADSCAGTFESNRQDFLTWNARVDSIRERVRSMEAVDRRGVAQDSYAVYMSAFSAYNDSVEAWQGRATALESELARCQGIAQAHNELADSVRQSLQERRQ